MLQPAEITDYLAGQSGCAGQGTPFTNHAAYLLDLQLFWAVNAQQIAANNGNLQSQVLQTCNGSGFGTAFNV